MAELADAKNIQIGWESDDGDRFVSSFGDIQVKELELRPREIVEAEQEHNYEATIRIIGTKYEIENFMKGSKGKIAWPEMFK
jgi:hypothetical protein